MRANDLVRKQFGRHARQLELGEVAQHAQTQLLGRLCRGALARKGLDHPARIALVECEHKDDGAPLGKVVRGPDAPFPRLERRLGQAENAERGEAVVL